MRSELILFKLLFKPLTTRAAQHSLTGRNRICHQPEKGRFTRSEVKAILAEVWHSFETDPPEISGEPTLGSKMNVRLACLTFLLYQTLLNAGVEKGYATELVGDICWEIYQWWGWLGSFISHLTGRNLIGSSQQQLRRVGSDGSWAMSFPFNPPGYQACYVPTAGGLGFDVVRCPVAEYFRSHNAGELGVATWCMLDYPLAQMQNLRLVRSKTLAAGDNQCEFRWYPATKKG